MLSKYFELLNVLIKKKNCEVLILSFLFMFYSKLIEFYYFIKNMIILRRDLDYLNCHDLYSVCKTNCIFTMSYKLTSS